MAIKLREHGVMLGKIIIARGASSDQAIPKAEDAPRPEIGFHDPNQENLVAEVSTKKIYTIGSGKKTIVLIDCGAKANIARSLANAVLRFW